MSQTISFKRPDGKECSGYYVEAATGDRAPGVVVIQEWWGVNDQIKGVANRLAEAGYRALVPDLYRGEVGLDAKEAEHLMTNLNFADAAGQDVRGAVQHLKRGGAKVAVNGFCMGGALSLLAAVNVPEADGVVCWYGFPPLEYIVPERIKAPLLGHFAIRDAFFAIQQVDALEDKLKEAHLRYQFHRYDAMHAFANETNVNRPIPVKYDPECAKLAWGRTMTFLKEQLA